MAKNDNNYHTNVDYKKLDSEVWPRIEKLKKQKMHLESFYFMAAILEWELTELVELCETQSARLTGHYGYPLNLRQYRERKYPRGMTLGQLRDYLAVFMSWENEKNKNLIDELNYFIDLRNECIHGLPNNNIVSLDKKVMNSIDRYYKLLILIVEEQTRLYKSLALSNKRKAKNVEKSNSD